MLSKEYLQTIRKVKQMQDLGDRRIKQGEILLARAKRLSNKGNQLQAEGDYLWSEAHKLWEEAYKKEIATI